MTYNYPALYREFRQEIYPKLVNGPRAFPFYHKVHKWEFLGLIFRVNEESNDGLFALTVNGRTVRGHAQLRRVVSQHRAEMRRRRETLAEYETAQDKWRKRKAAENQKNYRIDQNEHAEYAGEWIAYR